MTDKETIEWLEAFQRNLIKEMDPRDKRYGVALCATQKAINALEVVSIMNRQRRRTYEID